MNRLSAWKDKKFLVLLQQSRLALRREQQQRIYEGPSSLAEPFLAALMSVGAEHGGDLQLNELLQAVAGQLGDQLTGGAAIQ